MRCSYCGYENSEDAKFCAHCGDELEKQQAQFSNKHIETEQLKDDNKHQTPNVNTTGHTNNPAKNRIGIILAIILIIILISVFKNDSGLTEDVIYEDATDLLIDGLEENDIRVEDVSPEDLTTIVREEEKESKSNRVYTVTGKVYTENSLDGYYTITLVYEGNEVSSYEWETNKR